MRETITIFKNIWTENKGVDKLKYTFSAIKWRFQKMQGKNFIKNIHTGGVVKVYPFSAYSSIFYFKWPETIELNFIRKHSYLSQSFVDVGANVGLFSLHVIDCFKDFYLFEPTPTTFKALKETCDLNKQVNWNLFNIGISSTKDTLTFIDEGQFSGTNRFCKNSNDEIITKNKISAEVDTLDNKIPKDVDSMVLKIDVEGFEEMVFKGADTLFSQKKVKLVMFERLGRTNLNNIKMFFEKHCYVIFSVDNDGRISTNEQMISKPLINLFAMPEEIFTTVHACIK